MKTSKECNKCHEIRLCSEFSKNRSSKDGLTGTCRVCECKRVNKYYKDNRTKRLRANSVSRKRRREENPEKERKREREANERWKLKHPERFIISSKERTARYRLKHRPEIRRRANEKYNLRREVKILTKLMSISLSIEKCMDSKSRTGKMCARCKKTKPLSNFSLDKSKKDWKCSYCKECRKKIRRRRS
jgi:hypothetical protein